MPSIVLHAGMPKAGSSSIQRWLGANARALRERGTIVAVAEPGDTIEFRPYDEASGEQPPASAEALADAVNSGWIFEALERSPERTAERFVAALEDCAHAHEQIVVTGEAFAELFILDKHDPALSRLDDLARSCDVTVAFYVGPQHVALEAAWRQWGFRSGVRPAAYVSEMSRYLHHLDTSRRVAEVAPNVTFGLRRFRFGDPGAGSVVPDFAERFLGLSGVEDRDAPTNSGLPLALVNVLARAPRGAFWDGPSDNHGFGLIRETMKDCPLPGDDERIARSRQALRRFAHERFGAENDTLGWAGFVPPPDAGAPDLASLDELWAPRASPAELGAFFHALRVAIDQKR